MNFWERNNYGTQNATYENQCRQNSADGAEEVIRDKFEQYKGKSEDQLMSELSSTIARMKNEGTFDPATLDNLYNTASSFLSEEQRQRMRTIIEMFKG